MKNSNGLLVASGLPLSLFDSSSDGDGFFAMPVNRVAMRAAEQLVAEDADLKRLIIYGPSCSGKSHLMRVVANQWGRIHNADSVVVATGADYARGFADACKVDAVDSFSQHYRSCGLLVIDSLDELAGKMAAQEHFCRTLDVLEQRCASVAVTSSRLWGDSDRFCPPLTSRLYSDVCVALELPAEASRRTLIEYFSQQLGLELDAKSIDLLAHRIAAGVGEIRNRVKLLALDLSSASNDHQPTLAEIQGWLTQQLPVANIAPTRIVQLIAKQFGLTVKIIKGPSRRSPHVYARSLAMLAMRKCLSLSFIEIGRQFGGRDHSTVMHACRKMQRLLQSDQQVIEQWDELLVAIGEHRSSHLSDSLSAGEKMSIVC